MTRIIAIISLLSVSACVLENEPETVTLRPATTQATVLHFGQVEAIVAEAVGGVGLCFPETVSTGEPCEQDLRRVALTLQVRVHPVTAAPRYSLVNSGRDSQDAGSATLRLVQNARFMPRVYLPVEGELVLIDGPGFAFSVDALVAEIHDGETLHIIGTYYIPEEQIEYVF